MLILVALLLLSGCVAPKIEICNVANACKIDAPATVKPLQLPKEILP